MSEPGEELNADTFKTSPHQIARETKREISQIRQMYARQRSDSEIQFSVPNGEGIRAEQINEIKTAILVSELQSRNIKDRVQYRSCCGCRIDSRAALLVTQIFIIVICFIFTLVKLSLVHACEEQQSYMSLLTFLLGLVIPNPTQQIKSAYTMANENRPFLFTSQRSN